MKILSFNQFFEENKYTLSDGYNEYVLEMKQMGQPKVSFKTWANEIYNSFKDQGEFEYLK
jgi:hypothetical protein